MAWLTLALDRVPFLDGFLIEPKSNTSTVDQRLAILPPVADTVFALRFEGRYVFFSHGEPAFFLTTKNLQTPCA
jgi:hypothetical protein